MLKTSNEKKPKLTGLFELLIKLKNVDNVKKQTTKFCGLCGYIC